MRKLTFGMNLSLDPYIASPGDDIGWSVRSRACSAGWTRGCVYRGSSRGTLLLFGWDAVRAEQPAGAQPARPTTRPRDA